MWVFLVSYFLFFALVFVYIREIGIVKFDYMVFSSNIFNIFYKPFFLALRLSFLFVFICFIKIFCMLMFIFSCFLLIFCRFHLWCGMIFKVLFAFVSQFSRGMLSCLINHTFKKYYINYFIQLNCMV